MKILVLRFSSIGDIVLTSPVVRCIKKAIPHAEIHYATKASYAPILEHNPYIDRLHLLHPNHFTIWLQDLKSLQFDFVVDLHHNLRTARIKWALKAPSDSFPKLNIQKWLSVRFGSTRFLPQNHIVHRYFKAVQKLQVTYDGAGLDFFEGPNTAPPPGVSKLKPGAYICIAIGAQHQTKIMPIHKWIELLQRVAKPIVVLGGPQDVSRAEQICNALPQKELYNLCNQSSLLQSALCIKNAAMLLTHDTGLMHIAAAYNIPIYSFWGSTVPEFGMTPFFPDHSPAANLSSVFEVRGLACRPCSKIGFQQCPKKHFQCMNNHDFQSIQL